MMGVHGEAGDRLHFRVVNRLTGEELEAVPATEGSDADIVFRADMVGTLVAPLPLMIGASSGVMAVGSAEEGAPFDVYTLSGQKVRSHTTTMDGLPRGTYIVKGRVVLR